MSTSICELQAGSGSVTGTLINGIIFCSEGCGWLISVEFGTEAEEEGVSFTGDFDPSFSFFGDSSSKNRIVLHLYFI